MLDLYTRSKDYAVLTQPLAQQPRLRKALCGQLRVQVKRLHISAQGVGFRFAVPYEIKFALEVLVYQLGVSPFYDI